MPIATDSLDFASAISIRTRASGMTAIDSASRMIDVGSNAPAFDFDVATRAPLGLLCWEGRTNLIPNSQAGLASMISPNTAASSTEVPPLRGASTITKHTRNNGTADPTIGYQIISQVSGVTYAYSAWLWLPTGQTFSSLTLSPDAALVSASSGGGVDASKRDQWQRVTGSFTANANSSTQYLAWRATAATGTFCYSTEPQVEAGIGASPNIITTGGTMARASQDFVHALGALIDPTQGTIYAEFMLPAAAPAGGACPIQLDNGGLGDSISLVAFPSAIQLVVNGGGTALGTANSGSAMAANVVHKAALSFASGSCLVSLDGQTAGSVACAIPAGLAFLRLGQRGSGVQPLNGWLRRWRLMDRISTAAQLQAMTV